MKWLKRTMLLVMLMTAALGTLKVQAVYYAYNAWNDMEDLEDNVPGIKTRTLKVDLNKDGKKETIKVKCCSYGNSWDATDGYYKIYINNKQVMKDVFQIWIMDIDTRDRYVDVAVTYKNNFALQIYRYNGKKLVKYAAAKYGTIAQITKKNRIYFADEVEIHKIKTSGKGAITVYTQIYIKAAGDDGFTEVGFNYNVKKNAITYNQSSLCRVQNYGNDNNIIPIRKKWEAYKYPRVKSNKKIFTVNKGDKVKIMNFKFSGKYTYMKTKKVKTKQTGWVIFLTKDLAKNMYD